MQALKITFQRWDESLSLHFSTQDASNSVAAKIKSIFVKALIYIAWCVVHPLSLLFGKRNYVLKLSFLESFPAESQSGYWRNIQDKEIDHVITLGNPLNGNYFFPKELREQLRIPNTDISLTNENKVAIPPNDPNGYIKSRNIRVEEAHESRVVTITSFTLDLLDNTKAADLLIFCRSLAAGKGVLHPIYRIQEGQINWMKAFCLANEIFSTLPFNQRYLEENLRARVRASASVEGLDEGIREKAVQILNAGRSLLEKRDLQEAIATINGRSLA